MRAWSTFLVAPALIAVVFLGLRFQARAAAYIISVPMHEKVVAITFDDGPHPVFTREILKELERAHAKATFFMIGQQMELYPEVVKEVAAQGHVIGNHTYTHPFDLGTENDPGIRQELAKTEQLITRVTGQRPHLFRPPRGRREARVMAITREAGYRTVLWSVCADNSQPKTPEAMARHVLKHLRPGAIILVHDGTIPSRELDVQATTIILREVEARGYRFVTVPELLDLNRKGPIGLNPLPIPAAPPLRLFASSPPRPRQVLIPTGSNTRFYAPL